MKRLIAIFTFLMLVSFHASASDPRFYNYPTSVGISASGPAIPGKTITINATVQAQGGGGFAVKRINPDLSETLIGGTVKFFNGATQIGSVRVTPTNTSTTTYITYVDPACVLAGLPTLNCSFYYFYAPSTHLTTTFNVPINATGSLSFTAQFTGDETFSSGSTSPSWVALVPGGTLTITPRYNIVNTTSSSAANVWIPATQTTGGFAYAWNAPGYGTIDLQGKINNGPWLAPLEVSATGSTGDNIPLGSTYTFRILPHGGTTVMAEISFTGVAAPAPTFSVSPSHVIVPVGQTSGPFSLQWNAPGYETIDIQGRINGGAWLSPFEISYSGYTGDNLAVGSTYDYRFFPHGDTTHILGSLTVTASH